MNNLDSDHLLLFCIGLFLVLPLGFVARLKLGDIFPIYYYFSIYFHFSSPIIFHKNETSFFSSLLLFLFSFLSFFLFFLFFFLFFFCFFLFFFFSCFFLFFPHKILDNNKKGR